MIFSSLAKTKIMKKEITIYGNHLFFLELIQEFLEKKGFTKSHKIVHVTHSEEIEQHISTETEILILNLTGESILESFEHIEQWLSMNKDLKIIVLSGNSDMKTIKKYFEKGIKGYLGKDTNSAEFLQSLQCAIGGRIYINENTKNDLFNYICNVSDNEKKEAGIEELTAREIGVLNLICEGLRTKEIAEKLFISIHTVESHRRNIMLKLNINNSSKLVKFAIDHSLLK